MNKQILNVEDLNFAYGTEDIFKEANFRINNKEHIGLIGRNGSGKSTFLKLLTQELEPDSGKINKTGGLTIGYLEQLPSFEADKTIYEIFLSAFDEIKIKEKKLRELETKIAESKGEEQERYLEEYGDLQDFFNTDDAYDYESQIRGMTIGLGFTLEDLDKPFRQLSGGEKTRISLGVQLLQKPDLLLLDEPTNYLDISSLNWLENLLKSYPGSIILISHDRYFLDRVCTRIDEIENYKIKSYAGNYSDYLVQKEKQIAQQNQEYAKALKEINRQKAIIRRYRDINSKQSSKHARSREIALSKMEAPEKTQQEFNAHFEFKPKVRSGEEVLSVEDVSKSFDGKVLFENMNFKIDRMDKIGIIGPNGSGKTTLFNILRKRIPKDKGTITYGTKVETGYFNQENKELDVYQDDTLIDIIRESDISMSDGTVRNLLASFLFTGDDVFKHLDELSGGEVARIKLAKLMLSDANFLLLDEPTNHIDMQTKEVLENALTAYQGTLLFISHDRYFLNKVANKIFEFSPEGITQYLGNYDDYIDHKNQDLERNKLKTEETTLTKTQRVQLQKKKKEKEKELRKARKNTKAFEEKIEELEEKIGSMEEEMSTESFYQNNEDPEAFIKDYESLKSELVTIENDWEASLIYLEELEEEFNK